MTSKSMRCTICQIKGTNYQSITTMYRSSGKGIKQYFCAKCFKENYTKNVHYVEWNSFTKPLNNEESGMCSLCHEQSEDIDEIKSCTGESDIVCLDCADIHNAIIMKIRSCKKTD